MYLVFQLAFMSLLLALLFVFTVRTLRWKVTCSDRGWLAGHLGEFGGAVVLARTRDTNRNADSGIIRNFSRFVDLPELVNRLALYDQICIRWR